MHYHRPLLACAAAMLALPAFAAPPQSYFTFGAAHGAFETVAPPGCTLNSTEASATGGTLGVGYAFSEHLAIEFGFQSLGTLDLDGLCGITPITVTAPDRGLQLSGVISLPLGERGDARGFAAYGRLGAFSWSEDADSGVEPIVGVGLEWRFDFNTALRLEYDDMGDGLDAVQLTLRWDY
jgi:hypothetical protein